MNARKTAWDQEQQEGTKRAQENLREASAKLPDLIPQWRDASRAEKEKKELAQYLFNNGYSAEEVTRADDPRAISISYKAWKYDQLQAKRKQAKPVAPTVTKPGPAKNPTQDSAAVRSRTKLAKTGRIEDGMDYFRSKLYPR